MTYLTNDTTPAARKMTRLPVNEIGDRRDVSTPTINPLTADRSSRNVGLEDAELPLLREIASQMQDVVDVDLPTALKQARRLLESAFQTVDAANATV